MPPVTVGLGDQSQCAVMILDHDNLNCESNTDKNMNDITHPLSYSRHGQSNAMSQRMCTCIHMIKLIAMLSMGRDTNPSAGLIC